MKKIGKFLLFHLMNTRLFIAPFALGASTIIMLYFDVAFGLIFFAIWLFVLWQDHKQAEQVK